MRQPLASISLLLLAVAPGRSQEGVRFEPGCELPFAEIAVEREVDRSCGPQGSAARHGQKLQNEIKNDFCASGEAVLLLNRHFKELQKRVDRAGIPHGVRREPVARDVLKAIHKVEDRAIGEGLLVQHAGWIGSAEYLAEGRPENVNCARDDDAWKDIHLELAEKIRSRDRERISTEISPHFRPDSWTPESLQAVQALGLPVRVTGQLFFDGSHLMSNFRASNWEVHPVYRIEVCNSQDLADCRDGADGIVWIDLHEWVEQR